MRIYSLSTKLYFQKKFRHIARSVFTFMCLLLLCSSLLPFGAVASTATLTVTIVYDLKIHQFTSSSFSDSIRNTNDTGVRCDMAFPANMLSSGDPVIMTAYSTSRAAFTADVPLPSGKLGANTFYNFSFTNANTGSTVTSFDKPTTLTFSYSDADISGIDESTLVPYRWNGSSWSALTSYTIDTAANKITVSTQQFSTFALLGTAPAEQQQSSSSGGSGSGSGGGSSSSSGGSSGGGGGGYSAPATRVVFSGKASPKSTVTLLKDGQIAATTIAGTDADGNFQVSVSGISGGNYIFSLYSQDSKGNRSPLLTFSVSVASGATTNIGGVFLAGTLPKNKTKSDLNGDGRVNLVDFSIAAYWYKRPSPPATADLNGDGKVDLIDFSIMAFYWTG